MKKGSETKVIRRSEISFNPVNPKNHTDEEVRLQKNDIKRVGFLGGIVWNEASRNLIDGHRRVKALDLINKYDGTPETDYEIKVEAVDFDEKTEKEQLTYMALQNSKADYNLVARYINDIDYKQVGISDEDMEAILKLQDDTASAIAQEAITDFADDFVQYEKPVTEIPKKEQTTADIQKQLDEKPKMTKEQVKAEKRHCADVAVSAQEELDSYIIIDFASVEEKMTLCELLGVTPQNNMRISGASILSIIE